MGSPAPHATRCGGAMLCGCSVCRAEFSRRGGTDSIAQLAPGKLDKEVFEIPRTVQIADAVLIGEVGKQWRRVARIAEGGLAGELESLRELPPARVRPCPRFVAVHFDHFGLDMRG